MANTLLFQIKSFAADRQSGVLEDVTVYGTPARSTVAVIVKGQKIKFDTTEDVVLTLIGNQADPETDTEWQFNIPKDGWFKFLIVAVPDYSGAIEYDLYDAVYSNGVVYRSKQNGNQGESLLDTDWWEVISDPATLALNEGEANESANIDSTIYEIIVPVNSEWAYASNIAEASEHYLTTLNIPNEQLAQYDIFSALVNSMQVFSDRANLINGERIARRLDSLIES